MMSKNVLILLTLIGFMEYNTIEALQCYVCENCAEGEELQELHICGELPMDVESTTARPTATSTTPRTTTTRRTTASGSDVDSEDYDYSDEKKNEVQSNTTTAATTTRVTTTTVSNSDDYSDEDEDYDYDERRRNQIKKSKYLLSENVQPICYIIQLKVNNSTITNRGCTTLINGNDKLTCLALYNGFDVHECQLCNQNGCNKAISDQMGMSNLSYWNGAANNFVNHSLILFIAVLSMRYLWW